MSEQTQDQTQETNDQTTQSDDGGGTQQPPVGSKDTAAKGLGPAVRAEKK